MFVAAVTALVALTALPAGADPPFPTVRHVLPAGGPAAGGTKVVIAGTGFELGSRVRFGSVEAGCVRIDSDTMITAVSPTAPPGTAMVTVEHPVRGASPPVADGEFGYERSRPALPEVHSLEPPRGPATGHVAVVVHGRGFCRAALVGVAFGGRPASRVEVRSDTELIAVAPPHVGGEVRVAVAVAGRRSAPTAAATFRYDAPPDDAAPATAASAPAPAPGPARAVNGPDWSTCPAASATPTCPGPMTAPRAHHATVLLDPPACHRAQPPGGYPCGHVLAVAGDQLGRLDSAELYDPEQGSWRRTAPVATARSELTATVLRDGRVLAAGGRGPGFDESLGAADLYDPATETWVATSPLATSRFSHTATLVDGPACDGPLPAPWCGKVLVAGGTQAENQRPPLAAVELYDPATGTWSQADDMGHARANHTATLLASGEILVTGGLRKQRGPTGATQSSAEVFDPTTGRWRPTGAMAVARFGHTSTLLADGRVLVVGGVERWGGAIAAAYTASAEVYDPATGGWTPTKIPNAGRAAHTATLMVDGRVLVAGGGPPFLLHGDTPSTASVEIYDPGRDRWEEQSPLHSARSRHGAVLLDGPPCRASRRPPWCGRILVAGGGTNPDEALAAEGTAATRAGVGSNEEPAPIATVEILGCAGAACFRRPESGCTRWTPVVAGLLVAGGALLAGHRLRSRPKAAKGPHPA